MFVANAPEEKLPGGEHGGLAASNKNLGQLATEGRR
jgi:hypothetical protein